ncbi:hypothetical protein [Pseudoalteromonas sp.]|uniref:hypothetical protein n=1 Tax=Pseudoalteromonas sp. TaxID=53249 RepID=UPI0026294E50|nr:hypothetical protein [Pseudoalteromonas sp.]MCP4585351.1 hypothetical protein [Pseudoalteromonas sp.]
MKIKKVSFQLKSESRCKTCSEYLKVNLIAKKPHAQYCFKCYPQRSVTARQVRTGKIIGRKSGIYVVA